MYFSYFIVQMFLLHLTNYHRTSLLSLLLALSQKIYNFGKLGFEKQLIYNSDPLLCLDNYSVAKHYYWELETCSKVLNFCNWQLWQILRETRSCYISRTDGYRKLKLGKVSLQTVKNFCVKTN